MRFVIDKARNGQYYWNCHARNGEIIATSETYVSKVDAKHSINLIMSQAGAADVVDLSAMSRY
ncbi:YegP family protein [Serinicoccus marinus]|uniref:YegP family protein n=1 Tax=Serinicoccus marinus TaxID=247333 RepID=UPI0003B50CA4|nr:DUF1508 domain-containing protein [Serinicoccus marinus]